MRSSLKPFFLDIFLKTKGFMPVFPFDVSLGIGDYFLIENGELIKLGSLKGNEQFFDLDEPVRVSDPYLQPANSWQSDHLIKTSYKNSGVSLEFDNIYLAEDQHALLVEFFDKGSYFFRSNEIVTRQFDNFNKLSWQILQKFVSKQFNFKEIYLVTEEVSLEKFAIAVAEMQGNLAVEFQQTGYYGLADLVVPNVDYSPHQSRNISYMQLEQGHNNLHKKPEFIRAVRMDVSYEGKQHISNHIRKELPEDMQPYYFNMMEYAKTSILKLTNIFPGNATDYYSFFPMDASDISKVFGGEY